MTPPGARRNTLDTVTTADDGPSEEGTGVPGPGAENGAVGDGRAASAVVAVSFDALRRDAMVQAFIKRADAQLGVLGYTEHGQRHTSLVANIARNILQRLTTPSAPASWRRSPATCTTSATASTGATTPPPGP